MKLAIADIGCVGYSKVHLFAQHKEEVLLDIVPAKEKPLNDWVSPIAAAEIEDNLRHEPLDLQAALDKHNVYGSTAFVIIGTPTDCDSETNFVHTRSVESGHRRRPLLARVRARRESALPQPAPGTHRRRRTGFRSSPRAGAPAARTADRPVRLVPGETPRDQPVAHPRRPRAPTLTRRRVLPLGGHQEIWLPWRPRVIRAICLVETNPA